MCKLMKERRESRETFLTQQSTGQYRSRRLHPDAELDSPEPADATHPMEVDEEALLNELLLVAIAIVVYCPFWRLYASLDEDGRGQAHHSETDSSRTSDVVGGGVGRFYQRRPGRELHRTVQDELLF
ncbi:hypothetical protein FOZ62_008860, partial [Perkinsus olseni]